MRSQHFNPLVDDIIVPLPIGIEVQRSDEQRLPPFYCVHSITGNGVSEFRHLANFLLPKVAFFAFQVPRARRTAETGSSVLALATRYCNELLVYHRTHFGDEPFFLGGWSAGAIVALEMAQQLSRIGQPPLLLIAIDKCPRRTRAEIGPWNSTARNVWLWLKRSWRNADNWGQAVTSLSNKLWLVIRHGQLYGGPDSEYSSVGVIRDLTKRARSRAEREFIEAFYPQTTAYIPQRYHNRVLVLVTKDGYRDRVIEGWREIARERKVVRIAGSHESIMLGSRSGSGQQRDLAHVRALALALRREMRAAL